MEENILRLRNEKSLVCVLFLKSKLNCYCCDIAILWWGKRVKKPWRCFCNESNNCSLAIQRLKNLSPQEAINKKGRKEWQSIWPALSSSVLFVKFSQSKTVVHGTETFYSSADMQHSALAQIAGEVPGDTRLLLSNVTASSLLNHIHLHVSLLCPTQVFLKVNTKVCLKT